MYKHITKNKSSVAVMMLAIFALTCIPAAADLQAVGALVEALRLSAPKNNDPSLYTDWKMQAGAISSWSRRCLGVTISPAELAAQPIMARDMVTCVMEPILAEQWGLAGGNEAQAIRRAAAWWMTGDAMQYQSGKISRYLDGVLREYEKLRIAR